MVRVPGKSETALDQGWHPNLMFRVRMMIPDVRGTIGALTGASLGRVYRDDVKRTKLVRRDLRQDMKLGTMNRRAWNESRIIGSENKFCMLYT